MGALFGTQQSRSIGLANKAAPPPGSWACRRRNTPCPPASRRRGALPPPDGAAAPPCRHPSSPRCEPASRSRSRRTWPCRTGCGYKAPAWAFPAACSWLHLRRQDGHRVVKTVHLAAAAADALLLVHLIDAVLPQKNALYGTEHGAPAAAGAAHLVDHRQLYGLSPKRVCRA